MPATVDAVLRLRGGTYVVFSQWNIKNKQIVALEYFLKTYQGAKP